MGTILWFTGLSGAGKSTLAEALRSRLNALGKTIFMLDGDEVRKMHGHRHGFSREDIRENNRLIAQYAKEKGESYDFVLVSAISPFSEDRAESRKTLGKKYIEIFVDTPLHAVIARDTKGLYAKAKRGEMGDLIGMSDTNPYERPVNPDITIETNRESVERCVEKILAFIAQSAI